MITVIIINIRVFMKELIDIFIETAKERAKALSPRAGMIKECVSQLKREFKERLHHQEEGYTKENLSSALEFTAKLIEEANEVYKEESTVVLDKLFSQIECGARGNGGAGRTFAFLYGEMTAVFGYDSGHMKLYGFEIKIMLNELHEALKELTTE